MSRFSFTEADLSRAVSLLRCDPDTNAVLTIPVLRAGLLRRREVRAVLAAARNAGAEVTSEEQRGWLDSVFTIRLSGDGHQLAGTLALLLELVRSGGSRG